MRRERIKFQSTYRTLDDYTFILKYKKGLQATRNVLYKIYNEENCIMNAFRNTVDQSFGGYFRDGDSSK